jgi:CheY-like chemotaxis protein
MPLDPSRPVLVVDDELAIIRIVKTLLHAAGVTDVEGASSGPEAIRLLSRKDYACVICDYVMKPMNGADLKLILDRRPEWARVPFVMMSGRDIDETRLAHIRVDAVLRKPFNRESLVEALDRLG